MQPIATYIPFHIAWSCVCINVCFPVGHMGGLCKKTGEPIDVQFGETPVDHWIHVLSGVPIPLGKGIFWGGARPSTRQTLESSGLCAC